MKTPEEIALIGGGILLSSGLVFGLKGQATSTLPKANQSIGTVMQANSPSNNFDFQFKQAQQKGWQTGNWGSAKFYVDNQSTMHVGSGQLSGSYTKVVDINKIHAISLDDSVQASQDSSFLFANTNRTLNNSSLSTINHLSRLDTSQVIDMSNMFFGDSSLQDLDVSHFDTHNVTGKGMLSMFEGDSSLTGLDVSHFDTSHVNGDMYGMFGNDSSLRNLDVSHFNTRRVDDTCNMFSNDSSLQSLDLSNFSTNTDGNMYGMFDGDDIQQLTLGSDTKLQNNSNNGYYDVELSGTYQNGSQTLTANQLMDGNAHPGTWYKQ